MNCKFNLLHHVGVVAKRVHAAAETAPHEGDDNTPSGPTGRGVKTSKRWHLNVANGYGGNRIQNITQTLELYEAAEENY